MLAGARAAADPDYEDALADDLGLGGSGAPVVADSFAELADGRARAGHASTGSGPAWGPARPSAPTRDSHDLITGRVQIRLHVAR